MMQPYTCYYVYPVPYPTANTDAPTNMGMHGAWMGGISETKDFSHSFCESTASTSDQGSTRSPSIECGSPDHEFVATPETDYFYVTPGEYFSSTEPKQYTAESVADVLAAAAGITDFSSVQVLRSMTDMLERAGFHPEDMVTMAAAAIAYKNASFEGSWNKMDPAERCRILVLLCFVSHSYHWDTTCRLKYWHNEIFASYCSLPKLSAAVTQVLKVMKYVLRIEDEVFAEIKDWFMPRLNRQ